MSGHAGFEIIFQIRIRQSQTRLFANFFTWLQGMGTSFSEPSMARILVEQQILYRITRFYTCFSIYEQIFYPISSRLTQKSLAPFHLERRTINQWDAESSSRFHSASSTPPDMQFNALIFAVYEACARPLVACPSAQDSIFRPSMRFLSSREASGEPELSLSRFATPRPD
jgi:hypothetical protein